MKKQTQDKGRRKATSPRGVEKKTPVARKEPPDRWSNSASTGDPDGITPFGQLSVQKRMDLAENAEEREIRIPSEGNVIEERYRLEKCIGEGGMGIVFEAMDTQLKRRVAVKFLHPRLRVKGAYDDLFHREAVSMAAVRHANVVTIHDFGTSDFGPYFIMEYLSGSTAAEILKKAMDQNKLLPVEEALEIIEQASNGLNACHRAGVIHRDVKPSNIMVTNKPRRIVLMDFGLGVQLTEDKLRHAGTPSYLAPEVLGFAEIPAEMAKRVDLYSLGVTAFELLTGKLPFGTGTWIELLRRQQRQLPPLPSRLRPEIPPHLDQVILTALARDPKDRFDTCLDFLNAVRQRTQVEAEAKEPRRSPVLIVVDDDPDFRLLVQATAKATLPGCRVISASDGAMAMDLIEKNLPDVALVDIRMPGMNGMELCAALKGDKATRDLEVVVVTGAGGAAERNVLNHIGITRFLNKPIDPVHLAALLRELLLSKSEPKGAKRSDA